mmetsp:Transcript_20699/g.23998  ORF Transcript_20699/g.23998 Transcript_20699/m.23998 type:complete len:273 (+) Transcript_20699:100-918(+)
MTITVFKKNHTHLIHLCKAGKWNALIKVIRSTPRAVLQELTFSSGLNLFAIAVSANAPEEVVRELLTLCPESTVEVDQYGATPLHLACLNGTTPEVVSMICQHDNGQSARILDKDDSTPLHNAVEYGCMVIKKRHGKKTFADVESKSKTSSMPSTSENSILSEHREYLTIIKILCDVHPGQVHVATKNAQDTPLDIPHVVLLCNDVSREGHERICEIYSVLRETSIKIWREKKRHCETAGQEFASSNAPPTSSSEFLAPSLADSSLTSGGLE